MDLTIILQTTYYFRFVFRGEWYYIPAHIEGVSWDIDYGFVNTLPTNHAVIIREWI